MAAGASRSATTRLKVPAKRRGSTTASKKLFDILQESGEFSIEAWVVPANVTQEMAQIISYSSAPTDRNFALQQTLYNYDFLLLTDAEDQAGAPLFEPDGTPALSTPDMDEVLQATLQHVVATYSPIDGRKIFVNGELVSNSDPVPGGTFVDWRNNMAFFLGNEASNDGLWQGTLRLVAIHRRAITQEQVTQNFDAGVGEKFYLMFDISERIQAAEESSYILFEAQQYDSYAYLFDKPHFITLDGSTPSGIPMQGVRIAMNGQEAPVGQTYATLQDTLDAAEFEELGQPLSALGAVIPLEKGADNDEFFLTFDTLADLTYDRPEDPTLIITPTDATDDERAARIGVRTFDEIDATLRRDNRRQPCELRTARKCLPGRRNVSGTAPVAAGSRGRQHFAVLAPGRDRTAGHPVLRRGNRHQPEPEPGRRKHLARFRFRPGGKPGIQRCQSQQFRRSADRARRRPDAGRTADCDAAELCRNLRRAGYFPGRQRSA